MYSKVNLRGGPTNTPKFCDVKLGSAIREGSPIILDNRCRGIPVSVVRSVAPVHHATVIVKNVFYKAAVTEEFDEKQTSEVVVCGHSSQTVTLDSQMHIQEGYPATTNKIFKDVFCEEKASSETNWETVRKDVHNAAPGDDVESEGNTSVIEEDIKGADNPMVTLDYDDSTREAVKSEESPSLTLEDLACKDNLSMTTVEPMGRYFPQPSTRSIKVPGINSYTLLKDGRMVKMSSLIFMSGIKLLSEKIENSSIGLREMNYSIGQHVEKFSHMYPELREFNPDKIAERVSKYIANARKKIRLQASQGDINNEVDTFKNYSEEARFIKMLEDSEKVCNPPVEHKKIYYGAQSRYKGNINDVRMDILEEVECCFLCASPQDLVRTDSGKACRRCLLRNSSTENETVKNIRHEGLHGKEQAIIQQHSELMEMEETDHPKRKTKKTKVCIRNYTTGESDDELAKALLSHLKSSQVRESLEIEKLKLDVLIRKRKLQMNA